MSEQLVAVTYFHRVTCDTAGCGTKDVTEVFHGALNQFRLVEDHERALAAQGWRVFASRGRRWYCPQHGPSAQSKAREVTR